MIAILLGVDANAGILTHHGRNRAGTVTLTSADPTVPPAINFKYLSEGTGGAALAELDRQAVIDGLTFARKIANNVNAIPAISNTSPFTEVYPGAATSSQSDLETFVSEQSWGHHASCSCAIGADGDPMAVLDSSFRVKGTKGLRVVDASSFPRIPGFFLVVPTMMLSEKAADVILADV